MQMGNHFGRRMILTGVLWVAALASYAGADQWPPTGRFFHSGDGHIHLVSEKNNAIYRGRYRNGADNYDPEAYQAICRVFGAPCASNRAMSLRLIEFIDALQDRFRPDTQITITSGFRSPRYNTRLRQKGRLAAKASLHQYGMAADFKMARVPSKQIWEYVKNLGFGGTGYYQGETVHIDVGPARSWDEKSSGVGTGISDDNKLIGLVTDYDVYHPGDPVSLRFIRMTAFPIGVWPQFSLMRRSDAHGWRTVAGFEPGFAIAVHGTCPQFADIEQMDGIRWNLPAGLAPGRYRIAARFCDSSWTDMPAEVFTSMFLIK